MAKTGAQGWVAGFAGLFKLRIALLAGLFACTGALAAGGSGYGNVSAAVLGIFVLAAGAAVLNNIQDRHLDARMVRTENRILVTGRLPLTTAGALAGVLIAGGVVILGHASVLAAALGVLGVLCYNGIYTYLKRHIAWAAFPGALAGCAPVAAGWTAGGGSFADPRFLVLASFAYTWQIPHSLLLLIDHGDDYARAELPMPGKGCGRKGILWMALAGTLVLGGLSCALPLVTLVATPAGRAGFLIAFFLFMGTMVAPLRKAMAGYTPGIPAGRLSLYVTALLLLCLVEAIVSSGSPS